jgi:hypothetical protein
MIVTPAQSESYSIRLSMPPAIGTIVAVSLVTDGQSNIAIGGRVFMKATGATFSGSASYDATARTLTLPGAGSWLDLGFQPGQLFQLNGSSVLYKVETIDGGAAGNSASTSTGGGQIALTDVLTIAPIGVVPGTGAATAATLPFSGTGTTSFALVQWAATVSFDSSNFATSVAVTVTADGAFPLPANSGSITKFAKQPHLLSNIQGPLIVVGGNASDVDTRLAPAVMLPGEKNGPLFGSGQTLPAVQSQVNALNIFDDGAQGDQTGTMTALGLTGFGMGGPLQFVIDGTPVNFPGGISWGSLTVDPTSSPSNPQFLKNVNLTTVDTLNLMLGQGNDNLAVQGTPVPGPQLNDNGTVGPVSQQGGLTIVQGGGAALMQVVGRFNVTSSTITRLDGLSWAAYHFAVGQPLTLNGQPIGQISAINGATLTVSGTSLTPATNLAATVAEFGPATSSQATYSFSGSKITRPIGQSWTALGFAVGQKITVDGALVGTVASISGSQLTVGGASFASSNRIATVAVYDPTQKQVALGGNGISITGGGGPGPSSTLPTVTNAFVTTTNTVEFSNCTGKQTTCSSFAAAGFLPGQILSINGQALWTVTGYGGKSNGTLTVSGPPLPAGGVYTITAYSASPLVVLGSSTQDGAYYSGSFENPSAIDWGSKPWPDTIGDGSPDFIYPVADPFRYQGNNFIDASGYFASTPAAQLPSYGLTIYGGGGSSTIIDSPKAVDLIAVSNSTTTIVGQNGSTRVVKPGGLNVNPISRVLAMPAVNFSSYPDAVTNMPALVVQARGGVPPNSPTIIVDPSSVASSSTTNWVTTSNHPSFDVTYKLVLDGVTEPATQYANGQPGVNYTLYLNGILYTDEPFPNGTYTVTGTVTDFYGNTSGLGTAARLLVIDMPNNPVTALPGTPPATTANIATGGSLANTAGSGSDTASGGTQSASTGTGTVTSGGTTTGTGDTGTVSAGGSGSTGDGTGTVSSGATDGSQGTGSTATGSGGTTSSGGSTSGTGTIAGAGSAGVGSTSVGAPTQTSGVSTGTTISKPVVTVTQPTSAQSKPGGGAGIDGALGDRSNKGKKHRKHKKHKHRKPKLAHRARRTNRT